MKDEHELTLNKLLLEQSKSYIKTNPNVNKMYMNLSQITFEDDGSLKNKLIMKVQTDQ